MNVEQLKDSKSEMLYSTSELSKLKYVKVIYIGLDGKLHEIRTEFKFIGDVLISLYFVYDDEFNINYPQDVVVKFVTSDAMYLAMATLKEIKKVDNIVYLTLLPPTKMIRRQYRKYCRVSLNRPCILVSIDEEGKSTVYLSKSVNISASGILVHNLEEMDSDDIVTPEFLKTGKYHVITFLEDNTVLKLSAKYARNEKVNGVKRYAFHYTNATQEKIDAICKYVTVEQIKQLKAMQKVVK